MGYIDKDVLNSLEEALNEEVQDFTDSIHGLMYELDLHEKEPFIGDIVENGLDELKEFIIDFLTKYVKD